MTVNNDFPFVKNIGTLQHIHDKLKDAIYDVLFDLNMEKAIYVSNESEADSLSRFLATNCLYKLDSGKYIQWTFDDSNKKQNDNSEKMKKIMEFLTVDRKQRNEDSGRV